MPDEPVTAVTTEPEQPAVEEKPTGSNQTKKQNYTFDEHTAEVKRIIAKEKADWKKSADSTKSALEEQISSRDKTIDEQNTVIQEMVDLLKNDMNLDADYLELLSEKSPFEQLSALRKKAERSNKKDTPRTPTSQHVAVPEEEKKQSAFERFRKQ